MTLRLSPLHQLTALLLIALLYPSKGAADDFEVEIVDNIHQLAAHVLELPEGFKFRDLKDVETYELSDDVSEQEDSQE